MKKIGILTLHYSDNYGAVLQAYALRKIINKIPGCKADIINYIPTDTKYILYRNDFESFQKLCQKRDKFDEFLNEYCGIENKRITEIVDLGYDYYCIGSDQVWNINFTKVDYFLPNFDPGIKRFSYAASIGMSNEELMKNYKIFKKYIQYFNMVSLREDTHISLLKKITERDCEWVLDPTLLLEDKDYEEVMTKEKLVNEEFIFFYWLEHDDNLMRGVEFVNSLSRKYGELPIIHTTISATQHTFQKDGGFMKYESIQNFLWYIKHAKFVVTNSYHGTIFSIQFETPFYTFIVKSMRSRIDSLDTLCEISERIVEGYMWPSEISSEVNFKAIKERLLEKKNSSLLYLKKALEVV